MTAEQEILQQEEQLANAKRTLDLDALQRMHVGFRSTKNQMRGGK